MSKWKADPNDATPDECLIYDLWHDLNFCGCGDPVAALALMRDELRRMTDGKIKPSKTPHWWLLAYVLDAAELTEHGTVVASAWPTPKGEKLLAVLEGADLEAFVDRWGKIGLVPA